MKGNGLLQNFTTLSVEGCAKSVGQNAALENKPFIIGTLIDMKVTHQPWLELYCLGTNVFDMGDVLLISLGTVLAFLKACSLRLSCSIYRRQC